MTSWNRAIPEDVNERLDNAAPTPVVTGKSRLVTPVNDRLDGDEHGAYAKAMLRAFESLEAISHDLEQVIELYEGEDDHSRDLGHYRAAALTAVRVHNLAADLALNVLEIADCLTVMAGKVPPKHGGCG